MPVNPEWRELLNEMADASFEDACAREQEGIQVYADATDYGSRGCDYDELFGLLRDPAVAGSQLGRLLTIEHIGLRLKHDGELAAAERCLTHCAEGYQQIGYPESAARMTDALARVYLRTGEVAKALDCCRTGDELLGVAEITAEEGSTEEVRVEMARDHHRTTRYQVHSAIHFA